MRVRVRVRVRGGGRVRVRTLRESECIAHTTPCCCQRRTAMPPCRRQVRADSTAARLVRGRGRGRVRVRVRVIGLGLGLWVVLAGAPVKRDNAPS